MTIPIKQVYQMANEFLLTEEELDETVLSVTVGQRIIWACANAALLKVVDWLTEPCPHALPGYPIERCDCEECWEPVLAKAKEIRLHLKKIK